MAKSGKIQKKNFFAVQSGITASKISLYAASPEELDGRIVKIDLTRSLRGKSLELKLKVKNESGNLTSEPVSVELIGSYIRRAFRKGADYVEDSFVAECKDASVLVKPFMLTRNKVSRAVRRMIRDIAKEHLLSLFKTRTTKELFNDIMTNKIQKELSVKLKKIYPLALCEIRFFGVLSEKKSDSNEPEKKLDVKEDVSEMKISKKVKAVKKE